MEWVKSLNLALDYIEDNLQKNLTCSEIAGHVYISSFHFQRMFCLLTGITVGEYIRNRRLTLAGQDLTKKDAKVIDVALKYRYASPESFSKAFSRFHGITPNKAKKDGTNLKSFNRLTIKIILEGGSIMDYKILKKDSFNVVVKEKIFNDENSTKDIPAFWSEYMRDGSHKKVCGAMGICGEVVQSTDEFLYGIGCEEEQVKEIPEGFVVWTIPANTWAVFKCIGPMPHTIQDMWKKVYSEWLPKAEYEIAKGFDLEVYTAGDNQSEDYVSEIWLPVKSK